jgi:hypothetical protein
MLTALGWAGANVWLQFAAYRKQAN